MKHKCKFVKYRHRRSKKTIGYKCHACFTVVVVRKRIMHRMISRPNYRFQMKHLVVSRYVDVKDPAYQKMCWEELFGFEANHPELYA